MRIKIFSSEGYAGLTQVEFPVEVNAQRVTWCGQEMMMVSERELARIGAEAYQPDEAFSPSNVEGLFFSDYEVLRCCL